MVSDNFHLSLPFHFFTYKTEVVTFSTQNCYEDWSWLHAMPRSITLESPLLSLAKALSGYFSFVAFSMLVEVWNVVPSSIGNCPQGAYLYGGCSVSELCPALFVTPCTAARQAPLSWT